jgi:hypothetical protein
VVVVACPDEFGLRVRACFVEGFLEGGVEEGGCLDKGVEVGFFFEVLGYGEEEFGWEGG